MGGLLHLRVKVSVFAMPDCSDCNQEFYFLSDENPICAKCKKIQGLSGVEAAAINVCILHPVSIPVDPQTLTYSTFSHCQLRPSWEQRKKQCVGCGIISDALEEVLCL